MQRAGSEQEITDLDASFVMNEEDSRDAMQEEAAPRAAVDLRRFFHSTFLPVRIKIALLLASVALLAIGASCLFIYNDYRTEIVERNTMRAYFVADMVENAARLSHSRSEFQTLLATVEGMSFISFLAVMDTEGKIVASSRQGLQGMPSDEVSELKSLRPDSLSSRRIAPLGAADDWPYADFAGRVMLSMSGSAVAQKHEIFVRLNTMIAPSSLQARTWSFVAWLTAGVIGCFLIISLFLQRLLVAPIEGLRRFADKGETSALVPPVGPPDEISHVAHLLVQSYYANNESEAKLADFAMTDGLTGLGNRVLFKGRLSRAVIEAENSGGMVGVVVLNIDNFKDINDTLGHDSGDYVLQRTAENLKSCLRKGDTVARLGADEFGIILPGIANTEEATEFAQRVLNAVNISIRVGMQEIYQSACAGVTLFPQDGRDPDILIKNAGLALTHAKQDGIGSCTLYRHELRLRVMQRSSIERDLRLALARKQFILFYQPKFDIESGKLVGMEALIRWMHPDRGLVAPDTFISIAERSGVITDITCWVLDEACRQVKLWQEEGLSAVSVAVNVSAIDLRNANLADIVATTLLRHSVAPQYLELEVTESMVMHNVDEVIGTLRRLRSLGVGIGIDDFGTGYSSLAYLKRFPVKRLKIDRSFIQDISSTRDGTIIPKVIIDLAHSLNIGVIAEGVETQEQLEILRALGCDEAQGYLLGHPVPAGDAASRLLDPTMIMPQLPPPDSTGPDSAGNAA